MAVKLYQFPTAEDEEHDEIEKKFIKAWERFKAAAEDAYTWRDHEELDKLCGIIGEIRPWIIRPASDFAPKAEVGQVPTEQRPKAQVLSIVQYSVKRQPKVPED